MTILRDTYKVKRLNDCKPTILFMNRVNALITAMMLRNSSNGRLTLEEDNVHRKVMHNLK